MANVTLYLYRIIRKLKDELEQSSGQTKELKMKFKNYLKAAAIGIGSAVLMFGCSQQKSSGLVTSSFKMTGSSSAATVAHYSPKSIWEVFINRAHALMPASMVDSTGLSITLSEAWTVVKEVEFKSEEIEGVEDSEIEIEFQGPYVVDLLSATPMVLDTQQIAEKGIRRIKMKLHKAESLPVDAPAGLANNSIFVTGTVGGNNFTLQMDDSTEMQIAGPNSFVPGENSELLVEIQLANIFKQINMSTVVNNEVIDSSNRHSGANLCNAIDPSANDIYTCVRKGLEMHANFGQDNDGDDDLDSNDSDVD